MPVMLALVTFKKVMDVTGLDLILTPFTSDLANNAGVSCIVHKALRCLLGYLWYFARHCVNSMGIIDEEGNFPKSTQAYAVGAVSIMFGKSIRDAAVFCHVGLVLC